MKNKLILFCSVMYPTCPQPASESPVSGLQEMRHCALGNTSGGGGVCSYVCVHMHTCV